MTPFFKTLPIFLLLAACSDGNPFFDENGNRIVGEDTDTTGGTDGDTPGDGGDIGNDGANPPPGSDDPDIDEGIFRFEARENDGGGLVTEVSYDRGDDTFTVDNLAFDGANIYQRNDPVSSLNGYRVFAADEVTNDFLTGNPVGQIVPYRAVYGVSRNRFDDEPRSSFAIVRTGGYVEHGFGGYVYERNGGTVLPETGQATFQGNYGGMWTFNGITGLAYVEGGMQLDIDFEDFNTNAGVKGRISERVLISENNTILGELPDVRWVVEEGVMTLDENGELLTKVFTQRIDAEDGLVNFFGGTFTGLVAGDLTDAGDGGEIVGIVEMDATAELDPGASLSALTGAFVPNAESGTPISIKETGGAIVYRN